MKSYLVLCLCVGIATAVDFDCSNVATGKTLTNGRVVKVTFDEDTFTNGQSIRVTVESTFANFSHFSIMALDPTGDIWGTWENSTITKLQRCGSEERPGYMLSNAQPLRGLSSFTVTWLAPMDVVPSVVEFNISVILFHNEDLYFNHKSSVIHLEGTQPEVRDPHTDPSEFEEQPSHPDTEEEPAPPQNDENTDAEVGNPGEDPNGGEGLYGDMSHHADELDDMGGVEPTDPPVTSTQGPAIDLHDPEPEIQQAREQEEHRAQLIAIEDANSEGDWSIKEEEERRQREEEYEWELREQERIMYEEEQRRQEIVLWEIRDKEEHEAMLAQQTSTPRRTTVQQTPAPPNDNNLPEVPEDEVDLLGGKADGGSVVTATILTLITTFLLTLL